MSAPGALLVEPFGDHRLCFHEPSGRLALLDEPGTELWRRLLGGEDEAGLVSYLTRHYDVDAARARADVRAFVAGIETSATTARPFGEAASGRGVTPPARAFAPVASRDLRFVDGAVRVLSESAEVVAALDGATSSCVAAADDSVQSPRLRVWAHRERWLVDDGHSTVDAGTDPRIVVAGLLRQACSLHAARDGWFVALHAAAVVIGGTGVLLPAVGGSGKTTLAVQLALAGAGLVNDDLVVLGEPDLAMALAPAPVGIKAGALPLLVGAFPSLVDIPERIDVRGRRVRDVVLPDALLATERVAVSIVLLPVRSDDGPRPGELVPVGQAALLRVLLDGGIDVRERLSVQAVRRLAAWVRTLDVRELRYREAAAITALVLGAIA